MSPLLDRLESEWLAQLEEMREAISQLELGDFHSTAAYGSEASVYECPNDLKGKPRSNIWNIIEEKEQISNVQQSVDCASGPDRSIGIPYGLQWLRDQCVHLASASSALTADELENQLLGLLSSNDSDDHLQILLSEIVGYEDLEFVTELITHRSEICNSADPISNGVSSRLLTRQSKEEAAERRATEHREAALAPSLHRGSVQYPHVYRAHEAGNTLSAHGQKYALPMGSKREEHEKYEEYSVPANRLGVVNAHDVVVEITDMDGLCQRTFQGYKALNRMQSLVYNVAYKTNENMLICAPTGAGKTDAAMLTILSVVAKNVIPNPLEDPTATAYTVNYGDFKIVYVAPMKALAAEITEKLGKRLSWLGIEVRELTGDMHLTKSEIIRTQILVTTPEKWDVVTRKSTGDTELVQKVRLLIIDEVHMLHDERGAVLESLVARTERQVESTQSMIRIVGLSATLPNYVDVADFLKVNRMAGLFYFDASFRPVPLEQHFVGVKGKTGSKSSRENIETVAFEKVREMLELGHQTMVFVHSRRDTAKTARTMYEAAVDHQCQDLLDPTGHPHYESAARDMKSSKARELRDMLAKGIGLHHAGMARSDRNLVERLFADGILKVLCCTATLAWGVNLPAAAVIIKGTQLYSAQDGKFVDLGILDVLQIFGRAGRPQFQDTGIGYIITTGDKLQHYLTAVTSQQPIESSFSKRLVDNLNAEVALGTVTSISEAVQWLGYSYLFVRMQRNPAAYGIDWAEIRDDPRLVQRRRLLIIQAARTLQQSQMIIFNEATEELRAKDVGRIASQFYVLQSSIEVFNSMMRPRATEADVLKMISMSGEFDNIQYRESEEKELLHLKTEVIPCQVSGGIDAAHVKTNILLQSYISGTRIEDFALASDTAYVAQNSARICRALFMMALNRRWGHQCLVLLSLCKSIERQVWAYQHPFHQFDLPQAVLRNLEEKGSVGTVEALRDMESAEVGQLVHNQKYGAILSKLVNNFPTVSIEADIAPLNRDVLRIRLKVIPDFQWNDRHHGSSESFWIWVEHSETSEIYHHEYFILSRKKLYDDHILYFTIPLSDPLPSQIYVRAVSDRWLGAESVTPVSFQHLIRPDTENIYTDLLELQPLPITALKNPALEEIYSARFEFFNPMQTQLFHCMYHTSANVLLGSPTGSGKTVAAELAMWWAFRENPRSKVVYIAPMKALVRERVQDWTRRLAGPLGLKLVELTGDNTPDTRTIRNADIIITTPEKWDGISRSWQTRNYVRQVSLVIIDEIHLLAGERGPILEIIVSRMNYIASQTKGSIRLVGMSTACANAPDLGNWLGATNGLFNFRHSVRPVPLEIYIDGFPDQRGFCPLMQSMNRPTYLAIKSQSPSKPVIVFVASRRQTRLTAKDLINFCGTEDNPRRFVRMSDDDLELNISRVKDDALREALNFGIGLHHAGLVESDRQLAEELFANNKIQILVATSTLAWGVNLPAHLVVVKGTQFYDAKSEGYKDMDLTDVLQMLGRAGRPQFDSSGIARIFTQDSKKAFYKHFLHTGFPVESSLHLVLDNHLGAEIAAETIRTRQDALDYLTWTFLFRRLHKNPSYYGLDIPTNEQDSKVVQIMANDFLTGMIDQSLEELISSRCIELHSNGDLDPTPFGRIMSYYYISHKTIRHLLKEAKANATFEDVLGWMCKAIEYDELPVRHNEDIINAELASSLPLDAARLELPMWDPHVKAFLLLQAHFSRLPLPISDYVGDQTSVLDQSIRIIQASIDVLTELGSFSSCSMMITLLQCVKSARWPHEDPISILPGLSETARINGNVHGESTQPTLIQLTQMAGYQLDKQLEAFNLRGPAREKTFRILKQLPRLRVSVAAITATNVTVDVKRLNALVDAEQRMYAPKFPKPQTEGFFVLLSDPKNDEVIALKRLTWASPNARDSRNTTSPASRTVLRLTSACQARKLHLAIFSDGYLGMVWSIHGVEVPPVPMVINDGSKKGNG